MTRVTAQARALLAGTSAEHLRRLGDRWERLRSALPLRRRVSVLGVQPGAGCTTVAAQLCRVISSARQERVLAVSAGTADTNLLDSLGDAVDFHLLRSDARPNLVAAWQEAVGEAQRQFELTITDWGSVAPLRLGEVVELSHVVCLVTSAAVPELQRTLDLAASIESSAPVALAVVDTHGFRSPSLPEVVRNLPYPAHYFPFERRLRTESNARATRSFRYATATQALAADIVQFASATPERVTSRDLTR